MSAFEDTYKTGNALGEYQIVGRLGKGGMGVVYRGRHRETGVEYALKVLERGADEEDVARFQREGEAMARVDAHPNVVRVHSAGREGERRYLVMDLAAGGNLRERLRGGTLAPDEVARIGRDLARGLEHAHRHGVLHRDLKPANVLFDESGTPRLTDFGLAKMADSQSLTATGVVLGSPAYLAPEQALAHPVDERTDVFGLGAILYHALCGRSPHTGSSLMEVVAAAAEGIKAGPRSHSSDVPPHLDRIVRKAMARDPNARYRSAGELADALERYLEGDAEPLDPRERRRLLIALGVFAALLVAVAGVGVAAATRAREAPAESVSAEPPPPSPPPARKTAPPPGTVPRVEALVKTDPVKALGLLNTAARGGEVAAKRYLAQVYLSEALAARFEVAVNPKRAIELLTEAHEAGPPLYLELSRAWDAWAKDADPNAHVHRKAQARKWLEEGSARGDLECSLRFAGQLKQQTELRQLHLDLKRGEALLLKVIAEGDSRQRRKAHELRGQLLCIDAPMHAADLDAAEKEYRAAIGLGSTSASRLLEQLLRVKARR